jgi:ribosomal protein L37AE/L43A
MSTDCGPGVWALRDRIPETDGDGKLLLQADGKPVTRSATDKERNALFAEDMERAARRQERYGEYLISQGDAYDKTPKERILITNSMKTAARYYMREVPWIHELKAEDKKLCPFCLSSIDARALKCPSCNEIVEPARYAAVTAGKRAVKEAVTT